VQAGSRADLREKLRVEAGGVVFNTIQEFMPEQKDDRQAFSPRTRHRGDAASQHFLRNPR
jgi:hypothetical protein